MVTVNDVGAVAGGTVISKVGGDICKWEFVGDVSGEEMRRLLAVQKIVMDGCDPVLMLIDMSRAGSFTKDARKVGAEPSNVNAVGTAIFGASLHIRMLAKLVTTASAVLRKVVHEASPVHFFATETEALAWIDERRDQVNGPQG